MKILIVGLNYSPEKVGIAVYTTGMAEAPTAKGHEPQVASDRVKHLRWRDLPPNHSS